jgi:hypothetical protein
MTVSLLFNAQGEFYAVNLAEADIKQGEAGAAGGGEQIPGRTRLNPAGTPPRGKSPVPWPKQREDAGPAFPEPPTTDLRAGRRTPFDEQQR